MIAVVQQSQLPPTTASEDENVQRTVWVGRRILVRGQRVGARNGAGEDIGQLEGVGVATENVGGDHDALLVAEAGEVVLEALLGVAADNGLDVGRAAGASSHGCLSVLLAKCS